MSLNNSQISAKQSGKTQEFRIGNLGHVKCKNLYIYGDFNFDLLKYSNHSETTMFFDKMTSNHLVPLILIP